MGGKGSKAAAGGADAAGGDVGTTSGGGGSAQAYLVFSSENAGTLTLHWSTSSVSGAILIATPSKAVPQHKLTTNAGRIELGRNFGVSKQKMLEAFASFVNEAAALNSSIKVVSCDKCELWLLEGKKVRAAPKGSTFKTQGLDAVACMPANNTSFKGVQTIDATQFIGTATREGAKWKR